MVPSEIARRTLKAWHDITTLLQRTKRDGLVDVTPSTTDGKSVNIELKEKGRE